MAARRARRPWRLAPWLAAAAAIGSAPRRVAGGTSLTIRYYGAKRDQFRDADDWDEVCKSKPAMCETISEGECRRLPDEFAVPHSLVVPVAGATRWGAGSPGDGYMQLVAATADRPAVLRSGCASGCLNCTRVLVGVDLADGATACQGTADGAVFMVTGGGPSALACVDSLKGIGRRKLRYRAVVMAVAVMFLCLVCTFCVLSVTRHRHSNSKEEPKTTISKEDVERCFPALPAAPRRFGGRRKPRAPAVAPPAPQGPAAASPCSSGDANTIASSSTRACPVCVVCLTPIEQGQLCRRLQCDHCFHADCILDWWLHVPRSSLTCPTCRRLQDLAAAAAAGGAEDALAAVEAAASEPGASSPRPSPAQGAAGVGARPGATTVGRRGADSQDESRWPVRSPVWTPVFDC